MEVDKHINALLNSPCARRAELWEPTGDKLVKCNVCERHCIIPPNRRGMCGARYNKDGELFVLTYGNISSISNNPMSKKPFFNYFPNEYALTVGSWGCNFVCPWCQNFEISKVWARSCQYISPSKFIKIMQQVGSTGTSFSFNEPSVTLFEYSLDVMPLARANGWFNTYVTNGYMTLEAIDILVAHGLDAANIDIKGCPGVIEKWQGADVNIVWRNAKILKQRGVHIEITTLVIPTVNDDEECLRSIAERVKKELGPDTPWHVTRYFAAYKAYERGLPPETPVETVEKAYQIGKEEGLLYVYVGNVWPTHPYENTYCPNCGNLLIKRIGLKAQVLIEQPICPNCGELIHVVIRDKNGRVQDWRKYQHMRLRINNRDTLSSEG
ncbi:MAG: AmmeMemoRadiSam system radical SAM enzyme [Crenarchaeota archaeon]|nr:AmmeMemoRadiSam system radical SAM enzyme [Thermoproteota archaeon]